MVWPRKVHCGGVMRLWHRLWLGRLPGLRGLGRGLGYLSDLRRLVRISLPELELLGLRLRLGPGSLVTVLRRALGLGGCLLGSPRYQKTGLVKCSVEVKRSDRQVRQRTVRDMGRRVQQRRRAEG